jgi:uncharacterized protein
VKSLLGEVNLPQIPIPETGYELLLSILVVGLVPAVCEEVLNRGVLQSAFEKFGKAASVFMVSILFTLFHFSLEKLMGVFFLSLVISYIVYLTNSIFAGMLAHFINNSAAMAMSYAALKFQEANLSPEYDPAMLFPEGNLSMMLLSLIPMGIILAITATLLVFLFKSLKARVNDRSAELPRMKFTANDLLTFIPGLLIMAGVYLLTFLTMIMMRFTQFI